MMTRAEMNAMVSEMGVNTTVYRYQLGTVYGATMVDVDNCVVTRKTVQQPGYIVTFRLHEGAGTITMKMAIQDQLNEAGNSYNELQLFGSALAEQLQYTGAINTVDVIFDCIEQGKDIALLCTGKYLNVDCEYSRTKIGTASAQEDDQDQELLDQ